MREDTTQRMETDAEAMEGLWKTGLVIFRSFHESETPAKSPGGRSRDANLDRMNFCAVQVKNRKNNN